jgi:uncharacterized protein (TIGR02284 family)
MKDATINDLIEVLEDGRNFYEEAAAKVPLPVLSALFARMAATKAAIANDLRTALTAMGGTPSSEGTFAGSVRKTYAEVRAKLSVDKNHAYVAELEEFEDRILKAFEYAAHNSADDRVRAIAQRYMPEVSRDHAHMRELKHAKAA